jgi:hypothetical protein
VSPYIIPPIASALELSIKVECLALTNDHKTDEHGSRTSSLKSTASTQEKTCSNSAAAEIKSVYKLGTGQQRDIHGNHLHMPPFEILMQLVLTVFDSGDDIVALCTELVLTQTWWVCGI